MIEATEQTAIIEEITFNDIYPSMLPNPYSAYEITIYTPNKQTEGYKTYTVRYDVRVLTENQGQWAQSVVEYYQAENATVYAIIPSTINEEVVDTEQFIENIGICYYILKNTIDGDGLYFENNNIIPQNSTFIRPTQAQVQESNLNYNPWGTQTTTFDGTNWLEFLYNTGKNILQDSGLIDILTFNINGYNIFSIILGAGFIIYMGWTVTKWFIPL